MWISRRRHRLARTTGSSFHPVRLSLREGCHHGRRTPGCRNVSFAPHCVPRFRSAHARQAHHLRFRALLIIGETTQQALRRDFSFINAMLVIVTLVTLEIVLSFSRDGLGPYRRQVARWTPWSGGPRAPTARTDAQGADRQGGHSRGSAAVVGDRAAGPDKICGA